MSRFTRTRRVFFLEEPVFENTTPHLRSVVCPQTGVRVETPVLPHGLNGQQVTEHQRHFLHELIRREKIANYIAWFYTPMSLEFASDLRPEVTVYDCMDELSAFAGAPPQMHANEATLFERADLVFTGGASLFESKRKQHASVHLFPSSVDVAHFAKARTTDREPDDQSHLGHPRLGYAGVIDERMDLELIRGLSAERPDWQIVLLGPVVKINPDTLPEAPNLHYLGMKAYADLPAYFSGWDIGMLPFALNQSTRFISPTKTPEYLAAGLPVISTPIRDVVSPYGDLGLVRIASGTGEFVRAADSLLQSPPDMDFRARVDRFLSQSSWDKTWSEMNQLMDDTLTLKNAPLNFRHPAAGAAKAAAEGASHV